MIVWLASYPKSGNTWVRIFLSSLLSKKSEVDINEIEIKQFPLRHHFEGLTNNINDIGEFVKNSIIAQEKINLDGKTKIFKTHNAFWKADNHFFTDKENTLGCIYLVRDPRNVITSIMNHYSKENIEKALEFLKDEKKLVGDLNNSKAEYELPTVISSWKNHYNSWKKLKKNYLLIKYENLLKEPEDEFFKITKFLENISNFKFDIKDIHLSIFNSKFLNLKKQENLEGFIEARKNKNGDPIKFFNLGPQNNWEKILDTKIAKNIEDNFGEEMKELGYL